MRNPSTDCRPCASAPPDERRVGSSCLGRTRDSDAWSPESQVFILDEASGAVRFGDGKHGQLPPDGSRVRVSYRQGAGASGATVSWSGHWAPRPFGLAEALIPRGASDPRKLP